MQEDTILKKILNLIDKNIVSNAVKKYSSDKYSKSFKTQDHLTALIFIQLMKCRSLRDLEIRFNTGLKYSKESNIRTIKRSTLSYSNKRRSSLVFAEIAKQLVCRQVFKMQSTLEILDSSTITINGRGSDWTISTKTKCGQGLKLHVQCSENEKLILAKWSVRPTLGPLLS